MIVYLLLSKLGNMNNLKILQIKKLFSEGLTSTMVCEKLGINRKNIHYYINKYNIEVKNKYYLNIPNHTYFDNIDTEEKAYLLGFFLADGFVTNHYRLGLENSIDDEEIIKLFQKEISPNQSIRYRNRQDNVKKRKIQVIFIITSKEMCESLENLYDIKKNKTYNHEFKFNFDKIPEHLHRHFIRGFFDGDGSISFYEYNNTIFFNFSFVFNSLNFCEQIAKIFEDKFNISKKIYENQGKTCKYYALRFNYSRDRSAKIKEIYDFLYKDSKVYLKRKKEKFDLYLEYRAK